MREKRFKFQEERNKEDEEEESRFDKEETEIREAEEKRRSLADARRKVLFQAWEKEKTLELKILEGLNIAQEEKQRKMEQRKRGLL